MASYRNPEPAAPVAGAAALHNLCFEADMLEQLSRLIVVALLGCSMLSGCAYMTKRGRQRIAFEHYITKYSRHRAKQKQKIKAANMPTSPRPKNTVDTAVSDSPQSVTAGGEN